MSGPFPSHRPALGQWYTHTPLADTAGPEQVEDQTDQESRSAGHRAAPIMTAMDITIHARFLPHNDPDASLPLYRDTLGFEVRNDVEYGGMHWITVGPPASPARPR